MNWIDRKRKSVHEAVDAKTGGKADAFLHGTGIAYVVQNLTVLAAWIVHYVKAGATFYVVGDYDCDGVMAIAAMVTLLFALGAKNVVWRTPKRMSEGYGLSEKIVGEFAKPGVVITVDNGIKAHAAIAAAKAKGHVVLVTDHHEPDMVDGKLKLPPADLIVDPHVDDAAVAKGPVTGTTFRDYCGAGLVYKLAELLIPGTRELEQIASEAAVATITDVVPLVEDNRVIFKRGMKAILDKKITPGMQKFVDAVGSDNVITENDVAFKIGPMANAPGRDYDDGAALSVELVLSKNFYEANRLVALVDEANELRKRLKKEAVARATQKMEDECLFGMNPIVIVDEETPEGIVGLVAGELCERNNATAIVFTKSADADVLKGSARAADYNDVNAALAAVDASTPGAIVKFGGHVKAAGLSVRKDRVDDFVMAAQEAMGPAMPAPDAIETDMTIEAKDVAATADEVAKYAPYGEGNPPLVFRVNGFKLTPIGNSFFAKVGDNSIRFQGAGCEAIGFGLAEKYERLKRPLEMNLVGKISWHRFAGKATPQIELLDFEATEREVPVSDLSEAVFGLAKANGLFA